MSKPNKESRFLNFKKKITDVVIIAAIITVLFQFYIYKIEKRQTIINSKKEVIDKACIAYAKIARANNIMKKVTERGQILDEEDQELGRIFVEVLASSKLVDLYFEEEATNSIHTLFGSEKYRECWWSISNQDLDNLLKIMRNELKKDENTFWLFV
ncbi:hypothetical protein D0T84_14730 [Dysgonomonas sp. 521]|uniref:hypothetical protein n=1 Tax=Dysgonomonas sp. 521 TaxID=2302932 RepID=UPI0013D7B381|nr:hypothetical protein [Dysgonomonas sp. 521]NDV96157.1 hypothetical protein [Dysgonomonas sp. 521]